MIVVLMSIGGNFLILNTFPKGGQMKTDANLRKKKTTRSDRKTLYSPQALSGESA